MKMVRICRLLFFVTLLLLPISILCLPECKFPAVFNFGDSNSDTGGLSAMFGEAAAKPPNGETFFRSPAGRVCDGRVLIDFIAEGLGLPHLSAYLDSIGTNFSHGANYATIGSTIRRQNTTIFQSGYSPISLDIQYDEFSYFLKRSQIVRQRGDVFKKLLPEKKEFSSALYTFDIGQNDLTAGYQLNMSIEQVKAYVPDVISEFTATIKNVYASGGRTFWIHNTGPVGCLPYILDTQVIKAEQVDKHGCAAPFNDVSQYFNQKLKEAVMQLRKQLHLAAITYVDIFSVKYSLIAQAKKLAEGLGLPHLSPFLDSMGTNFSHGANYATAGSTIRRQNTTIFQSGYSPISLDVQYAEFSDFLKRSQIIRKKGDIFKNMFPSKFKISRALYTFDIGQNDLTAGYKLNMSTEQVKAYVPDVISRFITTIKNVYGTGGRAFWIHNTGPVGCLPYILDTRVIRAEEVDKHGCAATFNGVSQYFNKKLKEAVIELRKELPLAAITYVDMYSVKYSLFSQAKKLGFGDPFLVCCGHGGKYNFNNARRCGSTKMVKGKQILIAKSCKDPSSRILWDGIHFTEAANKWMHGQIISGKFSDPQVPLKIACHISKK